MAYSFTDPFRPLRVSLRLNGTIYGAGLGAALLLASQSLLVRWHILGPNPSSGPIWPVRLAGVALLGLGAFFWLAAGESIIRRTVLAVTCAINGLLALVLLTAYLGGQMIAFPLGARLLLIVLVALALVGTVLPLRYIRTDYRFR